MAEIGSNAVYLSMGNWKWMTVMWGLLWSTAVAASAQPVVAAGPIPHQEVMRGPFRGRQAALPFGYEFRLVAAPSTAEGYAWSNGWRTPEIFVKEAGWYWVDVTVAGQVHRDSLFVVAEDPLVWLPPQLPLEWEHELECLTPNAAAGLEVFELELANYWGTPLHVWHGRSDCWDMRVDGQRLGEGNYYWHCKYTDSRMNLITLKGTLFIPDSR